MLVANADHDEDDGDKNDNGAASDWSKELIGWLLSFRSPAKNAGDGEEGPATLDLEAPEAVTWL